MQLNRCDAFSTSFVTLRMLALISLVFCAMQSARCQDATMSTVHKFPIVFIPREESQTIDAGAATAGLPFSSGRWRFNTSSGLNLSIEVDRNRLDLKGEDCASHKDAPFFKVVIFPDDVAIPYRGCTNRSIPPRVSSSVIEVFYYNIVPDAQFFFTVTAKISGFVETNIEEETLHITSRKFPQSMSFRKPENYSTLVINLSNIALTENKPGQERLKKSHVTARDEEGRKLFKISNTDANYSRSQLINSSSSVVIITFQRAMFEVRGGNKNAIIDDLTDNQGAHTVETSHGQATVKTSDNPKEEEVSSNTPLIIGGTCGLILVIFAVTFVAWKLCKRSSCCCGGEMSDRLEAQTSTYRKGTTLSLPRFYSRNKTQDRNNSDKEKSVEARHIVRNSQMRRQSKKQDQNRSGRLHPSGHANKLSKREQRLSQLEETYIDMNFELKTFSSTTKPYKVPAATTRWQEITSSPESSHHIRPPLPIPRSAHKHAKTNKCDSCPEPDKYWISPAYGSVRQKEMPVMEDSSAMMSSRNNQVPADQYVDSESFALPVGIYTSTEHAIGNGDSCQLQDKLLPQVDDLEESYVNDATAQPRMGKYLSLTSHRSVSPRGSYVAVNSPSDKDLKRHFCKPTPSPGKAVTGSSAADSAESLHSGSCGVDPTTTRCQSFPNHRPKERLNDDEVSPSHVPDIHLYKCPRPSIPDVSIHYAFPAQNNLYNVPGKKELT